MNLLHPVIDKLDLGPLTPIGNHHVTDVLAHTVHQLETPDLRGRPAPVEALDIGNDVLLAVGTPLLLVGLDEPSLEVLVLDIVDVEVARLALDVTKEPVAVLAKGVVQAALLRGALDSGRADLLDLDVGDGGPPKGRLEERGER